MQKKICQRLFERDEWSKEVCQTHCNKTKQFRCEFLEQRLMDNANAVPAGFVDKVKYPPHPDSR